LSRRIFLHVGTHKTGTTSIQHFLKHERAYFERNGFSPILGLKGKPNFKELFHVAVSPPRLQTLAIRKPVLPLWYRRFRVWNHVRHTVAKSPAQKFIASSELLSFLREPGETRKLQNFFPNDCEFTIIVSFRDKAAFLASYKKQIERQGIQTNGQDTWSNYVKNDSWLANYELLLNAYSALSSDIRVIDFDAATGQGGNVIYSFCQTLGIAEPPPTDRLVWLNRS
jgi:hypothetical protein